MPSNLSDQRSDDDEVIEQQQPNTEQVSDNTLESNNDNTNVDNNTNIDTKANDNMDKDEVDIESTLVNDNQVVNDDTEDNTAEHTRDIEYEEYDQ